MAVADTEAVVWRAGVDKSGHRRWSLLMECTLTQVAITAHSMGRHRTRCESRDWFSRCTHCSTDDGNEGSVGSSWPRSRLK